jgi:CBS domain-containing protein
VNSSLTKISDLPLRQTIWVAPAATVRAAAQLMRQQHVSSLVVRTEPPSLVTERDLIRALAELGDPATPVSAVATRSPVWAPPTLTLPHAGAIMVRLGLRHLVVVDVSGEPIGVVSIRDALEALLPAVEVDGWLDAFPSVPLDPG